MGLTHIAAKASEAASRVTIADATTTVVPAASASNKARGTDRASQPASSRRASSVANAAMDSQVATRETLAAAAACAGLR